MIHGNIYVTNPTKKFAIDQDILLTKVSFKNTPSHPKCDLTVGNTLPEARGGAGVGAGVGAPLGSVLRLPPGALPTKSTFLHENYGKV